MNKLVQTESGLLAQTLNLRTEVLASLSDADLGFSLPGNPNLRELLKELGTVQAAYARSFLEFRLRFDIPAPSLGTLTELSEWFAGLDRELRAALEGLADEDLQRPVDRDGWSLPVYANFHVFREGLLIFAGKAAVYLKAMGKPLPKQLGEWIG